MSQTGEFELSDYAESLIHFRDCQGSKSSPITAFYHDNIVEVPWTQKSHSRRATDSPHTGETSAKKEILETFE